MASILTLEKRLEEVFYEMCEVDAGSVRYRKLREEVRGIIDEIEYLKDQYAEEVRAGEHANRREEAEDE